MIAETRDSGVRARNTANVLFSGSGPVRAAYRDVDWAATSLGPVEEWSSGLRTTVRLCMSAPSAMAVWAGPELVLICNEAYASMLGLDDCSWAGRPGHEVWSELWEELSTELARVTQQGEPIRREDQRVPLRRTGRKQITRLSYSHVPIREDDGRIVGSLDSVQEHAEDAQAALDLRRMFELSGDLLAVCGTDDRYRRVNPAFTRVLGWSEEDMLSHPGSFFVHPDDRTQTKAQIDQLAAGPKTLRFQNRFRHKDGSYRWISWAAAPVPEEGLIYTAGHDITERQRVEEALRESETRFREMADGLPLIVWVHDASGRQEMVNETFCEFFGVSRTQMRGGRWQMLMHPDDADAYSAEFLTCLRERRRFHAEVRVKRADGRWRWIESWGSPRFTSGGEFRGFVGTSADVTERKQAEDALQASEERFRALVTATSDVVYRMSPDWREMRELHGRKFIADTDAPCTDWQDRYVYREDQPRVRSAIEEAIRTKRTLEMEHRFMREDGSVGWTFSRAIPVMNKHGDIIEWFGAASDVTQRRRVEEQLRESDRRKDEFLAMLGHELRNPLAAIRNATELLGLLASEEDAIARVEGVLRRQSAHMGKLIDGLLEVSRIARGKIDVENETIDLGEIVDRVLQDRLSDIAARELELTTDRPSRPVWVCGDEVRLAQVLDNLVGNAIKFTQPPGTIHVSLREEEDEAVMRVRDTGIGIRSEVLQRLFEPFQQAPQTIARASGGLGLGLALAKGLVELHGGSIHARSDGTGKGTELEVRLPLAGAPSAGTRTSPPTDVAPRRVLVIEDSADAGQMLRELLEALGHDVRLVQTGAEALEALRARGAESVLCDLGLPDMSGYEVAAEIRRDPALRHVPLIAVTGYGQPEDRARTARAGFDAHLTKPVDSETLNEVLDRMKW